MTTPEGSRWPRRGDVASEIVRRGMCIGCGVCVAACRHGRLRMVEADSGAAVPGLVDGECEASCGVCLAVCPFWPGNPNEDEISAAYFSNCEHAPGVGSFRRTFAAAATDTAVRLGGSSGGVCTVFLREVLSSGKADAALVASGPGVDVASYVVCRDERDVAAHAGSRYVPLCLTDCLAQLAHTDERFVVVAVPCVAKAVRLLCGVTPALAGRVVGVVGLACGQTKRPDFWRFIGQRAGLDPDRTRVAHYRVKREGRPASDFAVKLESYDLEGKGTSVVLDWLEDVAGFWSHKWFSMRACLFCDDMTAECADVGLMDAWLPRFSSDWRGTSIVVSRSDFAEDILSRVSDRLSCTPVSPEEVLLSQKDAFAWKRAGLALRLQSADIWGRDAGGWKRVNGSGPARPSDRLLWRVDAWVAGRTQQFSVPLSKSRMLEASAMRTYVRTIDRLASAMRRVGR